MDKKAVIKQWKILKMFDAYNPNYAETQQSLLKKAQLGPAPTAKSEMGPTTQGGSQTGAKKPAPVQKEPEEMDEEPAPEAEGGDDGFQMSEHAKSLAMLDKAAMTKYIQDLTAAKPALQEAGVEIPKLVNFHVGSNSVTFLKNLRARIEQQVDELLTGDKKDADLLERCKQAVLDTTKAHDRMMRALESGKLGVPDYRGIVDRELTETLNLFKTLKKHLKNSKAVGEFFISRVRILQQELAELDAMGS